MEEKEKDKKIQDFGQVVLENNKKHGKIHLMTIIGEIEGHDVLPASINQQSMSIFCHSLHQLKIMKR